MNRSFVVFVALACLVPSSSEGTDAAPGGLPGAGWSRLAGPLEVNGAPVEVAVRTEDRSPAEALARIRAAFEALPVDLVERPVEGGGMLTVIDHHAGRRLVFLARAAGSRTEVLAGVATAVALDPGGDPDVALPDGCTWLAHVVDGAAGAPVHSLGARCELAAGAAAHRLRSGLEAEGFVVQGESAGSITFGRGPVRVLAVVDDVGAGTSLVSIRRFREVEP